MKSTGVCRRTDRIAVGKRVSHFDKRLNNFELVLRRTSINRNFILVESVLASHQGRDGYPGIGVLRGLPVSFYGVWICQNEKQTE